MKNCRYGLLLAVATLLLLAAPWVEAQTQPKKDGPLLAPKGFDKARTGIDKGKLETLEYESKTIGDKRKLIVYTPPGYQGGPNNKYPVFYLLHGAGGNETHWSKQGAAGAILDNLYADKKLVPMIVVMPNGQMPKAGADKKGKAADFESEMLNDIMPFAEGRYPIQKDAEHRAIGGLSMGGGQALRTGLKHLDKFAYVGGFSSAVGKGGPIPSGENVKKLKVLYLACGDSPKETLFGSNKTFHESLEKAKIQHVWNVFPDGQHAFNVWKNDLYVFSQMLFKDKK